MKARSTFCARLEEYMAGYRPCTLRGCRAGSTAPEHGADIARQQQQRQRQHYWSSRVSRDSSDRECLRPRPYNRVRALGLDRQRLRYSSALGSRSTSSFTTWPRQGLRCFSSTSTPRSQTSYVVPLPHRALIAVGSRDAARFLQGLTTINIPSIPPALGNAPSPVLASAFLNAQGRILQDVLIYPIATSSQFAQDLNLTGTDEGVAFLIEVDRDQASTLFKALKRYRLRSKVSLRALDPGELIVAFQPATFDGDPSDFADLCTAHGALGVPDERAPGMGYRVLSQTEGGLGLFLGSSAPLDVYRFHRYRHGVPEGQAELDPGHALVHESNLDLMGAVDFRKGCYVGQELVIRTQHTGVVRKRVVPVVLYHEPDALPETIPSSIDTSTFPPLAFGADIKPLNNEDASGRKTRSAGRLLANVGDVGLALVRLDVMAGLGPQGETVEGWNPAEFAVEGQEPQGSTRVKAFVPEWWTTRRNRAE